MAALPREIVALARRIPAALPVSASAARHLCSIASDRGGEVWESIGPSYRRDRLLSGAWLRHDWRSGAPPMAIGRVGRYDSSAGAYYVAIGNGEVLSDNGKPLLFSSPERAQRAATLAAVALSAQRLSHLFIEMVRKADTLTEKDLVPFDESMRLYRGAVQVAGPDWARRSIGLTIPAAGNLGAMGRRLVARLLSVETPATRFVQ